MARNSDSEFTYEFQEGFDYIIEESGNTSSNLRRISWNGRPYKLDFRKYSYKDGQEMMMKGISMSEDGASELASVLVENGYGDTRRIIKAIRGRDDFDESLLDKAVEIDDSGDEEYYDPKQLLKDDTNEGD